MLSKLRGMSTLSILAVWASLCPDLMGQGSVGGDSSLGSEGRREVRDERLDESSGLAVSWNNSKRFWTHNDSGDQARLFLVEREVAESVQTERCVTVQLRGAEAVDWEDMAAVRSGSSAYLFVADVGDNLKRRETVELYVLQEPAGEAAEVSAGRLTVRYQDGPRDCEAIAVDGRRGEVLLIEKSRLPWAGIYLLRLPADWQQLGATSHGEVLVAERVGSLAMPMITAADMRADGRQLAVITYFDLFLFDREETESWPVALAKTPRHFALPKLRQTEAVAYDQEGELWISSERYPMVLQRVSLGSHGLSGESAEASRTDE